MKYKLVIDPAREESLELILHKRTELADKIEGLLSCEGGGKDDAVLGYRDFDVYRLSQKDIVCAYTDGDELYAMVGEEKYRVRSRLYELETILGEPFIKLNRGCIVRASAIVKFESSLGGSIRALLSNGFGDYISRRELQNVKRRFGL